MMWWRLIPLLVLVPALVASAGPVEAQTPVPAPAPSTPMTLTTPAAPPPATPAMPMRAPLPAPPGVRPFPTPQELVGRELGLEEAVNIALENAPKIVARIGDYVAAQQRVNQALAPLLPQLTAQGAYGRQRTAQFGNGLGRGIGFYSDFGNASVTASQLLFDFGRTWAAKDVAKSNAQATKELLEGQKLDISLLVKTQYFTLLLSKRLVEVNLAALDRAEVNLRSAQGFFQVGTQPKSFVTRAEVDVANGRVNVIVAQNAVSLARVALNTAMGIAVNAPTEVKNLLSYVDFPTNRDQLVSEALQNRPEYRGAKAQADATEASVRQTFRDFFPNLFATSTYGLLGIPGIPAPNSRSTSGFIDNQNQWSVGLNLTWTIFDGGGKIGRYKEAKANLEAAQARVRDTELQVWQNVEQAYLSLGASAESIGAASKAVESAEENYQLARGRFDAGVANIIELTDAQLALTQAQSTQAQALSDYRINIANLERALGRR